MVGASEAIRTLGIPRSNFYRAIRDGRIPAHPIEQPWNRRSVVLRFDLAEVREALGLPASAQCDTSGTAA